MSTIRLWGGEVHLGGFYVFGVLVILMAILKLTVFEHWSWWRVSLPVTAFVGYNATYMICGFIYLSVARLPEETEDEEVGLDEIRIPHRWISMLFFVLFADNMVRWLDGTEEAYWFWLLSGAGGAVTIFGTLSVVNLFLYWSAIGRALREPD